MVNYIYALDQKNNRIIRIYDIVCKDEHIFICIQCKQLMIPKMGNKNSHHFAHKNLEFCENDSPHIAESLEHLYAKQVLCFYLNNGGKIISNRPCCLSNDIISLKDHEKSLTEYKITNGFADIAIVNTLNSEVIYIIEIYKTHLTKERPGNWSEFRALDIIKIFENHPSQIIILNDIKSCICQKLRKEREDQCVLYFSEDCTLWNLPQNRLMMLFEDHPFYTIEKQFSNAKYCSIINEKRICLICYQIIGNTYPCCYQCYIKISQSCSKLPCITVNLEKDKLEKIKSYFFWIKDISDHNSETERCLICTQSSPLVKFYNYKLICIDCLIIKHNKLYPDIRFSYLTSNESIDNILNYYINNKPNLEDPVKVLCDAFKLKYSFN